MKPGFKFMITDLSGISNWGDYPNGLHHWEEPEKKKKKVISVELKKHKVFSFLKSHHPFSLFNKVNVCSH